MMDHTAETIARLIRASDEDGEYIASDSEAALLIKLFVSAKIADEAARTIKPFGFTAPNKVVLT
jgi:hypothetical protein